MFVCIIEGYPETAVAAGIRKTWPARMAEAASHRVTVKNVVYIKSSITVARYWLGVC